MRPVRSSSWFAGFAKTTARVAGRPPAFFLALSVVVVWLVTGPIFRFSDTWQLAINTGTTIVTFLMVFLIQNSQNRDAEAVQVKLDELLRVTQGAHNALLDLEELEDLELEKIRGDYAELAKRAREDLRRGVVDTGVGQITGILLLLVGLSSGALRAQTTPSSSATILRLEDGWAAALVRRDAAYFERTLARGFIYTEDARSYGRAELLHELVTGTDTVTAAHNEAMQVHRFGATVIVTGWLIVAGRGTGGPFIHRYRFTDVWLRPAARWQIVAAHDYLLPAR
ncbi:MAG TPA: low affinity iron permease family protein [Gemmatimonadales bacterium]|jgi:low affinity Fe/Cu permease|nr:low affinity iron permease family protein [Gemmatimonadales bacterium]